MPAAAGVCGGWARDAGGGRCRGRESLVARASDPDVPNGAQGAALVSWNHGPGCLVVHALDDARRRGRCVRSGLRQGEAIAFRPSRCRLGLGCSRSSVVPDWGRRTACPSRADKHRRVRANHPLLPVTASRSIGAVPHAGLSTGRRRLGRLRSGSAAASAWSTKRRPSPAVRRTWALASARPPSRSSSRTTAQVCAGARCAPVPESPVNQCLRH
jgi:hypothetical protein